MVLKKQTVWLLTMLSLMVVLSAYYLFNHEPMDVNNYVWEDEGLMDSISDMDTDENAVDQDSMETNSETDFFITERLNRETMRAREMEDYEKLISSAEANAQTIAESKAKMDTIEDLSEAEMAIESLLKAEGYEEALVVANTDQVNVVVRTDSLDKQQAVSIIHLVREHLKVAGNQINVTFR